ncbi:hypothetical protein ACFYS8_18055 [Kitasatospora sp. NPDC004615]|uniref:hypothetical protein n=1 Tax=Kitasatospora sp. NPDC004615 TaxID=3364017 RepID=UPI00369E4696
MPSWAEHPGTRPRNPEALFTAGARLDDGETWTAEIHAPDPAGLLHLHLHLPTGRIIAADPAELSSRDGFEAPASGTLAAIVDHLAELRVNAVAAASSVRSERSR